MLEIYRSYRDAEYMAYMGHPRATVRRAIVRTISVYRFLRRQCKDQVHIKLDVWGDQCWHRRKLERTESRIERLEQRANRPSLGNLPVWNPAHERLDLDEVAARPREDIDYHYWRHP